MKLFSKFKRAGQTSTKKLFVLFALFLTLSVGGLVGVNALQGSTAKVDADTLNCSNDSPNSIIRNGAATRTEFINDLNANTTLGAQLRALYGDSRFGLTKADYNNFINHARAGVARDDATIWVDGVKVATNVRSIGRTKACQGPNPIPVTVGTKTYWGNYDKQGLAFAPGTNSIPVQVLFDDKGKMQFAVMMNSCGNPTFETRLTPPVCKELNAKKVGDNKFELTTSITPGTGSESVNKVVYTFSDGRPSITRTDKSNNYQATVTISKDVKVTAHVWVNVPGGGIANSSNCEKQLTFTPPPAVFACDLLTVTAGAVNNQGNTVYTLTAKAHATNATIVSYTFHPGDGTGPIVKNTSADTTSVNHPYAPGDYTAKVLVTFKTNTGKIVTDGNGGDCLKSFTVKKVNTNLVCDSLTAKKGAVDAATGSTAYTFTAKATPTKATISSYVFNFDNSATQTVQTSATTATSTSRSFAPGSHTVTVTVKGTDIYGNNLSNTNANCKVTFTVPTPQAPGVTITKHVDNVKTEQVAVGQVFTYELVVTNTGNVDLVNAVVTDTPPTGVTLLTADKGTITNNTWTYTIPSLKVGASISINLTAKVPAQVDGDLVNTACVNAVEVNPGQPNQTDSCDTATVTVPPVVPTNPNITITKTVDGQHQEQVNVNQNFVYQIVVKNTGEVTLNNTVVTDQTPTGVTLVSADLGTIADNNWSYTVPTLDPGASVTVNITAVVKAFVPGALTNTACVNAVEVNPQQPTQPDSCATAVVTVTPPVLAAHTEQPTQLVNTGAGSVIGLFGLSAVLGSLGYRFVLSRRLGE